MKNLKDFVEETNAYIVITSTWRLRRDNDDKAWAVLLERLDQYGLSNRVIDSTVCLMDIYNTTCCRGYEIQKWLDSNENIDNFVIIDDDNDMFHLIHKLAKCEYYDGFSEKVKLEALKIINDNQNKIRV